MGIKNVILAALAFGVCLWSVPAAFAQNLDSQGRVTKPQNNRISTQRETVYGREKAQREADRQADFHSRLQPKRNEAWTPRRYNSSSYKSTTTGGKAADTTSSSTTTATPTDVLGGADSRKSTAQDYARTRAIMRDAARSGGSTSSSIANPAPFSGTTTPGYVGTIPSRVTPDASKSTNADGKPGDTPSLYGDEQDANEPAEVPDLLKHVKAKKSSKSGDKEDADAQK